MIPTFKPRRFKRLTRSRGKIKKEPKTDKYFVNVPELRLSVQIKNRGELKEWLVSYCDKHPEKKDELYKNYKL